MKNVFKGYLPLNSDESTLVFKESIIAFDTSSILNLYRYEESTTNEILDLLTKLQDRLWLPYIAGLEYHTLRPTILRQQVEIYDKIKKKIQTMKKGIAEDFSDSEHFSIPIEALNRLIDDFESRTTKVLDEAKQKHPQLLKNDHIRNRLTLIFHERVGAPLTNERLEGFYKEAQARFDLKIPPGYKDKTNKLDQIKLYGDTPIKSEYADYLIWKEILELATSRKKSIILVTDEKKEDWVWKEGGYILGARPELITEIRNKAGVDFHILSTKIFLEKLSKLEDVKFSTKSISDIENTTAIPWRDEVLNALESLGGKATLDEIYAEIKNSTKRKLSNSWESTARRTIYYYCSDTEIFLGKEDLFEKVDRSTYAIKELSTPNQENQPLLTQKTTNNLY